MNEMTTNKVLLCLMIIFFSTPILSCCNPASTCYVQNIKNGLEQEISNIPAGPTGPQGAEGPVGPQGPAGTDAKKYAVCDEAMGGVVIWVNSEGNHGLIAAKSDLSSSYKWSTLPLLSLVISGAQADGVFAGHDNTTLIISREAVLTALSSSITDFAALSCQRYAIQEDGTTACNSPGSAGDTCYADWYLPSQFELNQLYLNKGSCINLTGLQNAKYWSSTEVNITEARAEDLTNGAQSSESKVSSFDVRCIRSF